jgi:hypothetical protein
VPLTRSAASGCPFPRSIRELAVRFADGAFPDPDDTRRAYATVYVVLDRAGCIHLPWEQPDIIGLIAQRLNAADDALLGPVPSWMWLDGVRRLPPILRGRIRSTVPDRAATIPHTGAGP